MSNNHINVVDLEKQLQQESPQKILKYALTTFDRIAISFSGAEDVALIEMALNYRKDVQIFSLDTGRLHPETYRFIEKVRKHFGVKIDVLSPNGELVNKLVSEKGLFSFYEDDHKECCGIRKIEPLRRKLLELDAWITGQRKDQSIDTRQHIPAVQWDSTFSTLEHPLVKFNPLLNWRSSQVWDYIHAYQVPYNALHGRGYISIGCEPCTRAILPNQHERAGRWWWEDETKKECGLHASNLKS